MGLDCLQESLAAVISASQGGAVQWRSHTHRRWRKVTVTLIAVSVYRRQFRYVVGRVAQRRLMLMHLYWRAIWASSSSDCEAIAALQKRHRMRAARAKRYGREAFAML